MISCNLGIHIYFTILPLHVKELFYEKLPNSLNGANWLFCISSYSNPYILSLSLSLSLSVPTKTLKKNTIKK